MTVGAQLLINFLTIGVLCGPPNRTSRRQNQGQGDQSSQDGDWELLRIASAASSFTS